MLLKQIKKLTPKQISLLPLKTRKKKRRSNFLFEFSQKTRHSVGGFFYCSFATMLIMTRLLLYLQLLRLHKPIGILLLLWPTLWALWFASQGMPNGYDLFAFTLGTVLMRSAGCAINDFADRDFDKHVKRTAERPLTSGKIKSWEAIALFVGISLVSLLLILPYGRLTWLLACVAAFLAASYPFTKRFFALPQAYLGIAFGFGIPMAFAAIEHSLSLSAWLLLLANVFWALAYDTEYAMVDRDDDVKLGIRTAAITFGRFDVLAVMICYACALGLIGLVGFLDARGGLFYGGLAVAAGIAVYHFTLIRGRDRAGCFKAFNHNNWLGAAVFIGLALDFAL
jgi:4-hydroxybenzoate polyprenyltransferase